MLFPLGQIYYPEYLDRMISVLWTHSSNTNLREWRPNHFVPYFPDVFDVSSSFDLPHANRTEKKEVTIPSRQSKTFVECDNSNSTSNNVNDEPMDMADMFTTDKTDKNQVEWSLVLDFSHFINSQDVSEKKAFSITSGTDSLIQNMFWLQKTSFQALSALHQVWRQPNNNALIWVAKLAWACLLAIGAVVKP